jgi:hypothetical protein
MLQARRRIYSHRPFTGEGVSLYLASGATDPGAAAITYRNDRCDLPQSMRAFRTSKTARVASQAAPTESFTFDVSAYAGLAVRFQLRPYLDDVELEVSQGTRLLILDGDGDDTSGVLGSLVLLETEIRAGGDVRIKTRYTPSLSGLQPESFTVARTAGPTSPANVLVSYTGGDTFIDFDYTGLSSASAYTVKIFATVGVATYDLLTGITFTADTTGPSAPTASLIAS